jgi:hypothetical protein
VLSEIRKLEGIIKLLRKQLDIAVDFLTPEQKADFLNAIKTSNFTKMVPLSNKLNEEE